MNILDFLRIRLKSSSKSFHLTQEFLPKVKDSRKILRILRIFENQIYQCAFGWYYELIPHIIFVHP